jgi:hypothetical protein
MMALAKYNSWRRGDETFEMPSPMELGSIIDDAVNILREHTELREEEERLRKGLESLAYWSRSKTETRITLRDRIAAVLANDKTREPTSDSHQP